MSPPKVQRLAVGCFQAWRLIQRRSFVQGRKLNAGALIRDVLRGCYWPVGGGILVKFGVARRSHTPTRHCIRTYNCKPALESHAGCTHRGTYQGKLVDGELIAFPGSACYPCQLLSRSAPTVPQAAPFSLPLSRPCVCPVKSLLHQNEAGRRMTCQRLA
jgi:hypothetical protein